MLLRRPVLVQVEEEKPASFSSEAVSTFLRRRPAPAAVSPPLQRTLLAPLVRRSLTPVATASSAVEKMRLEGRARKTIDEKLKLITDEERKIDDAQAAIEQARKVVEAQLRLANISYHTDGVQVAEIVESWSKQTTVIDPKIFKNNVTSDVFWGCVKVGVEKAKEHLAAKEFAKVSTEVPGKLLGHVLKISKKKVRRS